MIVETVEMDNGIKELDLHSVQYELDEYFILFSTIVGLRSTCIRRSYGIVIVKDKKIISFGYNGNYDNKHRDCISEGTCLRTESCIADNEEFAPCLREELGLNIKDEDLIGSDIYVSCYDKLQKKYIKTDIDECCLKDLKKAGVHRFVFAV